MDNRQEKLKSFFEEALAIESVVQREDFLRRECQETSLRGEVEELLQQHLKMDDSFLEPPTRDGVSAEEQSDSLVGTRVGAYKLLEVIGDGGMGTVFMAEQESPVRRIVAVKIIKAGMDSKEVIARFESERQAMAIMNHRNISRIFDAGTTESGRPYFVMELVKGQPVNRFCQQHRLGTRTIVELFIEICHAVQHAHQKGIIHRDLKPGNIMVELHDVEYVPKIIDFGVAKATNQKLTEQTLFTRFSQIVGTPAYMSPEQAELSGLDVDTRSDVYSLGIVLYELLAGLPPFDRGEIHKVGYDEMRRIIREEVPPKPSDRISTLKAGLSSTRVDSRGRSIGQLKTELRGDLDWIVMKALEKDRRRRYQSARELAEDLQRYLNNEAVEACPPSVLYRASKFVNRHRVTLTACSLIAISIVGGLIATSIEAYRANDAEQLAEHRWQAEKSARIKADDAQRQAKLEAERANQEAALAKAVSSFLQQDLLGLISRENQINVGLVPDPEIQLVSVLDRASQNIAGRFDSSPLVEGSIRYTIGSAYQSLGLYKKAEPHLALAVDLGRQFASGDQLGLSRAIGALGSLRVGQGRFSEAEDLLLESYDIVKLHVEKSSPYLLESLNALIVLRFEQEQYQEARKLSEEFLEICRDNFDAEDPTTLTALSNLASQLGHLGEDAESEEMFQEVFDIRERTLGPDHPSSISSLNSLAVAMTSRGHHKESQRLFEDVVQRNVDVHGPDHPSTLLAQANLGHVLGMQLKHDEAEEILVDTLVTIEATLGADHPLISSTQNYLASVYESQGRFDEANQLRQISNRSDLERLGDETRGAIVRRSNAAGILQATGQSREAEREYLKAIELARLRLGPQHDVTLTIRQNLGVAFEQAGRLRDARKLFEELLLLRTKADGRNHVRSLNVEYNLAFVDVRLGKRTETIIQLEDLVQRMEKHLGKEHPTTLMTLFLLGNATAGDHSIGDRYAKAEQIYRQVFERRVKALGLYHPKTIEAMRKLAEMMTKQGAPERAREFLQAQVATASKEMGPEDSRTQLIRETADKLLANLIEDVLAESRLLERFENRRSKSGIEDKQTQQALLKLTGHHKSKRNFQAAEDLIREQLDELRDIERSKDQTNVVRIGQFPLLEMELADVLIAKEQSDVEISESPEVTLILQSLIDHSIEFNGAGAAQELDARLKLASLLEGRNLYADALKQQEIRLEIYREKLGLEHSYTWMATSAIYRNLAEQRRFGEAEALLKNIIDYYRRQTGVSSRSAHYQSSMVQLMLAQGKLDVAEEECRNSSAELNPGLASDNQLIQNTDRKLALIYQLQGRPADSESHLKSMLEGLAAGGFEDDSVSVATTSLYLAKVYSIQERFEEAENIAHRVFDSQLERKGKEYHLTISAQRELATALIGLGRFDEAALILKELLAHYESNKPRDWKRFSVMSMLGECHLQNAENHQAEPLLLGAYQGLKNHLKISAMSLPERQQLFTECTERLIRLYTGTTQRQALEKWKLERESLLADAIQATDEQ